MGEGAVQQLTRGDGCCGLVRGGARDEVDGVTEVLSCGGNRRGVRGDDRGQGSQPGENPDIAVVAECEVADGGQIGLRAGQQVPGLAGPFVVDAGEFAQQCRLPLLDVLRADVVGAALLLEQVAGDVQIAQPEQAVQGVVKLCGPAVEKRAQFVVGEERAVHVGARQPRGVGGLAAITAPLTRPRALVQVVTGPRHAHRDGRLLAGHHQADLDLGRSRGVQVAPALAPQCGVLVLAAPPGGGAGQRQLRRFGEARLARAVASGDDRQAGTGLERERGGRADSPEGLDADGAEIHLGGSAPWRRVGCDARCARRYPSQHRAQRALALEGGKDELPGTRGELVVGGYMLEQALVQTAVVSHRPTPSARQRSEYDQNVLTLSTLHLC